jgi:acyl-CoA dehydrogenase
MRVASPEDRRYLLYNPVVKMKVTTQCEEIVNLMWDVIAAKGFEKDMYFEMVTKDVRCLPKLEGTVHVNIALIVKFMANYFFNPAAYEPIGPQTQATNDDFLFRQGPTKGLGKIRFHDYSTAFASWDTPNVRLFSEQINVLKTFLATATPDDAQRKDIDFLLSLGELFTLVVYGQLILENATIQGLDNDHVDQIFDFMVRDFSKHALEVHDKPSSTPAQMALCLKMLRKPAFDAERYERVWNQVHALKDAYEMND